MRSCTPGAASPKTTQPSHSPHIATVAKDDTPTTAKGDTPTIAKDNTALTQPSHSPHTALTQQPSHRESARPCRARRAEGPLAFVSSIIHQNVLIIRVSESDLCGELPALSRVSLHTKPVPPLRPVRAQINTGCASCRRTARPR